MTQMLLSVEILQVGISSIHLKHGQSRYTGLSRTGVHALYSILSYLRSLVRIFILEILAFEVRSLKPLH